MIKVTPQHIAELLYDQTHNKKESEVKEVLKEIVALMRTYGLLGKSQEVIEEFYKIYNKAHGIQEVTVTLQERLTPTSQSHIKKMLKDTLGAKDIFLKEKVDQRIIGGIKIETDDGLLIDGTVQGRMAQLQKTLTQ